MVTTAVDAATGTVYVLKDPRDLRVRYVGATTVALTTRLAGHLTSPASEAVRAWVAELKAAGLLPIIEPVRESVPVAKLSAVETGEIHARTMHGEQLLNINGTGAALKILAEREAKKARRRDLSRWRATATRIRIILGGPLAPGFDAGIVLSDETWVAIRYAADVHQALEDADARPVPLVREIPDPDNYRSDKARLLGEFGHAVGEAQRLVVTDAYHQLDLGDLWGLWGKHVRECVEAAAGNRQFSSRHEAGRYLALIRWYLTVIPPWRHLAYRCGIHPAGPEFHSWVTDDLDVRTALRVAEKGEPFIGDAADAISGVHSYEPGLLDILGAVAIVYSRQRLEPDAVGPVLRHFARHGHLDTRMAKALLTVDPRALDHVYGPDHATRIDQDLNLPAGTAARVVRHLDALLKNNESLHTVVKRADAKLPVAALPDVTEETVLTPGTRAIVAGLITAGRIKAPVAEATAYLTAVRAWWTPRPPRS